MLRRAPGRDSGLARARAGLQSPAMRFPLLLLGAWLPLVVAAPDPLDAHNVVWDSPSRDHHGSMPLGNGDVALNAWFTPAG